jgi:hypothetical protein
MNSWYFGHHLSEDSSHVIPGEGERDVPYRAHSGFLACAKDMLPSVIMALPSALESARKISPTGIAPVLLFSGHSAGGALATFLYVHIMKDRLALRTSKFTISVVCLSALA